MCSGIIRESGYPLNVNLLVFPGEVVERDLYLHGVTLNKTCGSTSLLIRFLYNIRYSTRWTKYVNST